MTEDDQFSPEKPEERDERERNRLEQEQERHQDAQRNYILSRIIRAIYYLSSALAILIFLRFVLRLAGANPQNQVFEFIYSLSEVFVYPFRDLFATPELLGSAVLDLNALIALVTYLLLTWLFVRAIWIIFGAPE